ncbi:hydantoinase B/oxoprolinase family protein, partial [Ilumatobacter sp.]|uniref:hydantoinase B/oxoprolinase family protein n=1 Tax=Ilumatobacter sp. TaxID=1967498 RepID=UPI003C562D82
MTITEERPAAGGFDPIELEICWQSLIATVNEQAKALQRSAFSPIVREAGDLA